MKKNEISTPTVIMLWGLLIFIDTLGDFCWYMPDLKSFAVLLTL